MEHYVRPALAVDFFNPGVVYFIDFYEMLSDFYERFAKLLIFRRKRFVNKVILFVFRLLFVKKLFLG